MSLLDMVIVIQHPSQLDTTEVSSQWQTADILNSFSALVTLGSKLLDGFSGTAIRPYNGRAQWLA